MDLNAAAKSNASGASSIVVFAGFVTFGVGEYCYSKTFYFLCDEKYPYIKTYFKQCFNVDLRQRTFIIFINNFVFKIIIFNDISV